MSGALASRLRPADAEAQQRNAVQGSDTAVEQDLHEIRDAIRDLRGLTGSSYLAQIQERQHLHFKLNQKFPNYIDIGLQVWERLTLWHFENQIPLKATRTPDGRMEMELLFTTLVLKADVPDSFVGNPYD